MFVGHGLVAFAIAASVAARRDWPSDRALAVGVIAGLFATAPDVDMLYAVSGLIGGMEGLFVTSDAFWAVANEVHRAVTHSLVVGAVAAVGFAGWRARSDPRLRGLGATVLVGLVAVAVLVGGTVTGAIVAAFLLVGLGIVSLAAWFGFDAPTVGAVAALGLLSHPFGDVLTGDPPALFYPFDARLLVDHVALHPDPTIHLLGAFFVELATIWLAVVVFAGLRGYRLREGIRPRAALGLGYGAAVLAIPAPTLEVASPFVFSVLAVGFVGVPLGSRSAGRTPTALSAVATALAAVTLAAAAYAVAYLVVA